MRRRGIFALFLAAIGRAQTRISNSQLPVDVEVNSLKTGDPTRAGSVSLFQQLIPGIPITVAPEAVKLSAPLMVTAGYVLVFPPGPPAPGQTQLVWGQPVSGVCTGSWQ